MLIALLGFQTTTETERSPVQIRVGPSTLTLISSALEFISQISPGLKYATNTKNKIKRKYYRLRISGDDLIKYYNEIGFISKEKQRKLQDWMNNKFPAFL